MALGGQLAMLTPAFKENKWPLLFFFLLFLCPPTAFLPLMPLNSSSSVSTAVDRSFLRPREKFFDQIHNVENCSDSYVHLHLPAISSDTSQENRVHGTNSHPLTKSG